MAGHDVREVQTPLGRRIKCRNVAEFRRVTKWVAWLKARQTARNQAEPAPYHPQSDYAHKLNVRQR